MPRSTRRRPVPSHPATEEIDLLDVLHALADPTRMTIVRVLRAEPERACGTFPVDVAPSTLSHHFKVLRESGLITQREEANRRFSTLRTADLEQRFPKLLDTVLAAHAHAVPGADPGPVATPQEGSSAQDVGHGRMPGRPQHR
ncbi:ArsR/SmtB family transcription factor [Kitasatospora purpeofusca]|uniref:ArsR/SmtB family transcription factor n=1 Tax=Kitasatospora purpeofusca TaxID=67352 RepID=UPI00386BCB1A|nr:metalloregulator ArsR/SmtB family transcription factor [Kitasatospora purpeofusca]